MHRAPSQINNEDMKTINFKPVDDLYNQFPELQKRDVTELNDWAREQLHLPPISGI